jgi:hypothetical protein
LEEKKSRKAMVNRRFPAKNWPRNWPPLTTKKGCGKSAGDGCGKQGANWRGKGLVSLREIAGFQQKLAGISAGDDYKKRRRFSVGFSVGLTP